MPSVDLTPLDEALATIEDIGKRGWRARQAYIRGDITLAEFEAVLEDELSP